MPVLISAHLARPENFHEIARLGVIEAIEVWAEPQFVEKASCAWPVRIPAAPDSLAIVLIPDDEPLKSGIFEVKVASRAQSLDCLMNTRYVAPEQKLGPDGTMKNFPDSKCAED